MWKNYGEPLGPTAIKIQGPQSCGHKEMKSANDLKSLEVDSCPVELPDENAALGNALIAALWDSEQRIQSSCV